MTAWYNEIDPYCAEWLRNLIAAGEIPEGDVDERPIEEVTADDVRPYTQCHFFAGIAGWALAARLAGWSDDRPLWTGSCPCQPFSAAGKRLADRDPRNLWPVLARLIAECRPARIAGEQVASKAGRLWLAGVRADLEALGYGVGAADLCAAGVSAPHARQRLWWLADMHGAGRDRVKECDEQQAGGIEASCRHDADGCGAVRGGGSETGRGTDANAGRLGDPDHQGSQERHNRPDGEHVPEGRQDAERLAGLPGGFGAWDDAIWTPCADGKARRIEPGIEPLVTRLPGHVEQVRAYGNSIVPQEAAEVLMAWREVA